jgi:ATP-dependent DNA helicase DinG
MSPMVAIDIETTGLDPKKDAIIEIGAMRFDGKRILGKWTKLINPGRPIPPEITQLTGITNEMVRNAPSLKDVLPEFIEFAGEEPVLGHHVDFDLAFLQRFGILKFNEVVDTYELASVLLPTTPRYSLASLGVSLGVSLEKQSHRGLDDAELTHRVYLKLYERALSLPLALLGEFVRLGEDLEWNPAWLFAQVLKARSKETVTQARLRLQDMSGLKMGAEVLAQPLRPSDNPSPLDEDEVASLLEHGGPFSKYSETFEYRPQQVEMLRAVAHAFSACQHLMAEAGTGTGKSLAYLIPSALWAIKNQMRVVISTNTINLQDQLIKKDIPDLRAALNLDLRTVVLKGRSNYLCPRRLELLRSRTPDSAEAMRILAKVLVWLYEGGKGDRSEINLNGPIERQVWNTRLSSEDEGCKSETCLGRMEGVCPLYQAKQGAQSAHLIIVNHALLLSDVVAGNRILPDYNYLIVDEAHHLEAASTDALTFSVNQNEISRLLRELGGTASGALGALLSGLKESLRPSESAELQTQIHRATTLAFDVEQDFQKFFLGVSEFLESMRDGEPLGKYGQQVRIIPATRTQPAWENVDLQWGTTQESLTKLISQVSLLHKTIADISAPKPEIIEDPLAFLGSILRNLTEVQSNINGWVDEPNPQNIYWADVKLINQSIAINVAPLNIGPLMENVLWHEKSSIILTSATLTANDEFSYIKGRLNADEASELIVGSPFDYENSALLFIANDIPEPSDAPNFQRSIEHLLPRLGKATNGRMLVLFTSYDQLKRTSKAITPLLNKEGIMVFEQGEGASSASLLETFRGSERAVLLGTRSFWEGVDIVGEALSCLVIVKLPFDVPSDPIIAARSETFDDPFFEYNLPEAILRFRQGFGRLIRTQSDRGLVVVLDKRVLTKKYGKMFIDSLPPCTQRLGTLAEIPDAARKWLDR